MLDSLLDLLFPKEEECPLCSGRKNNGGICANCSILLTEYLDKPRCQKCGRFFADLQQGKRVETLFCVDCIEKEHSFYYARALGPYEGVFKEALGKFKYTGMQSLAKVFATYLAEVVLNDSNFRDVIKKPFDTVLIPVPLSFDKEQQRGFNQSSLLAVELSKILGHKVLDKVLIKAVNTLTQAKLVRSERIQNLEGAFKVADFQVLKGKKVILIDDIFTTGSTIEECSKTLNKGGAEVVLALTVATGYRPLNDKKPV